MHCTVAQQEERRKDLLIDLASKPFINGLVGDPVLITTLINGDKWYQQNVRQVSSTGTHAMYVNVDFYVVNEGQQNEAAYYKDADPAPSVQWTAFQDSIGYQIGAEKMGPPGDGTLVDFEFVFIDETWKAGVIKGLIIDPADPEGKKIIPQGFYIKQDDQGKLILIQMSLPAEAVAANKI